MLVIKVINPVLLLVMRIISVIVFFLTICAAYGGRINPDYLTFPSMLALVFPYLAILTIVLIVFWIFCKKIILSALGVLTIFICLNPLSEAMPLGSSKHPGEGAETFKIISWNVLHTEDIRKPDYPGNRAVEFMINSEADVICLAELNDFSQKELRNADKSLIDSLFSAYPYRGGKKETDLKILSKYPVERTGYSLIRGNHQFDFFKINFPEGNVLTVGIVHLNSFNLSEEERQVVTEINSVKTIKTSVKELNGSIRQKMRSAFRKRAENAAILREVLDELPKKDPLIICGDFNDVPTSWTYNIIRGEDMRDAYAETNFGPAITYNLHMFYFHIDQMLYRGDLEALNLKVDKINCSDHYPLVAEFEFTKQQ